MSDLGTTEGAIAEVRKVRDTADKLAEGDYAEGSDHVRVLAGMIRQLAEQVERLAVDTAPPPSRGTGPAVDPEALRQDGVAFPEEDRSADRGPAAPLADPAD